MKENELAGYFLYNEEYKEWEETHAGTPNSVPLYTHPVKEQLTEEQVIDITKAFFNIHPETQLSEKFSIPLYELTHFARAILRKAQEK